MADGNDNNENNTQLNRRGFLKKSGTGLVALGLSSLLAACGGDKRSGAPPKPSATQPAPNDLTKQRWAACFNQGGAGGKDANGNDIPIPLTKEQLQGWKLLALDPDDCQQVGTPLSTIPKETIKLAYVDVGEIETYRSDFADFQKAGVLIPRDPTVQNPDNYVADITKWDAYYPLMKKRIEKILQQTNPDNGKPIEWGGIMLDALDTTLAVSKSADVQTDFGQTGSVNSVIANRTTPVTDEHGVSIKEYAIKLVRQLRIDFPDLKIMVNRGFDITDELAKPVTDPKNNKVYKSAVDMVMAESTITNKDNNGQYYVYNNNDPNNQELAAYNQIREKLKKTGLPIYGIDYWSQDPSQQTVVEGIYNAQRKFGYCPYVTTDDKQRIYKEPAQQAQSR